jgi:membrane protease YdiL (CAAX protease family)
VAAATIEEVLFRGIVLCGIWQVSRRAGATPSIALAAGVGASVLAFVAQPYHLQQIASRPGLAVSFVASGVVLAMLVAVLRSLPAAIGVHVTLNAVALMAEAIELSTVGHAARTTAVLVVLGGLAALMWIRSRPTVIDITDEAVAAMRR